MLQKILAGMLEYRWACERIVSSGNVKRSSRNGWHNPP